MWGGGRSVLGRGSIMMGNYRTDTLTFFRSANWLMAEREERTGQVHGTQRTRGRKGGRQVAVQDHLSPSRTTL